MKELFDITARFNSAPWNCKLERFTREQRTDRLWRLDDGAIRPHKINHIARLRRRTRGPNIDLYIDGQIGVNVF